MMASLAWVLGLVWAFGCLWLWLGARHEDRPWGWPVTVPLWPLWLCGDLLEAFGDLLDD